MTGLVFGESARWHGDRLWCCDYGRTPFMVATEWHGFERMFEVLPSGQVLTVQAPAPAATHFQ